MPQTLTEYLLCARPVLDPGKVQVKGLAWPRLGLCLQAPTPHHGAGSSSCSRVSLGILDSSLLNQLHLAPVLRLAELPGTWGKEGPLVPQACLALGLTPLCYTSLFFWGLNPLPFVGGSRSGAQERNGGPKYCGSLSEYFSCTHGGLSLRGIWGNVVTSSPCGHGAHTARVSLRCGDWRRCLGTDRRPRWQRSQVRVEGGVSAEGSSATGTWAARPSHRLGNGLLGEGWPDGVELPL